MRRLFTLCSALLSLLLCAAAIVMWVRSERLWEWVAYQQGSGRLYTVTSRLGAVAVDVTDGWPAGQFRPFELHSDPVLIPGLPPPSEWGLLGFGVDRLAQNIGVGDWSGPSTGTTIIIPYWFLALITIVPPLMIALPALARRRRRREGRCPVCGYDLRATPDQCPECGASYPRAA